METHLPGGSIFDGYDRTIGACKKRIRPEQTTLGPRPSCRGCMEIVRGDKLRAEIKEYKARKGSVDAN